MRPTTDQRRASSWRGGAVCTGALAVAALALGASSLARAQGAPVARLAAIMDYVQADYAGAVVEGRVVAPAEYQEQRGLLEEARSLTVLAAPLPGHAAARASLGAGVERLVADFRGMAPEAGIAADGRAVVAVLFDDYGLAVGPLQPPSLPRATELYGPSCAPCHGVDGQAQTENARKLSPPPVSFFNVARLSRISPRLAFEALEYGVGNTAMASFQALAEADRWSLAFKVVAWRHAAPPAELARGASLYRILPDRLAATPSRLSELTDADIEARLLPELATAADRAAVLAWLRDVASFSSSGEGLFGKARTLLQELDGAAAAADASQAPALAARIFTEGVRPRLPILRVRDRRLARRLEDQLGLLRAAASTGTAVDIREAIVRTNELLDRAEECRTGGRLAPWGAAMLLGAWNGAALACLLALALLGGLSRRRSRWAVGLLAALAAGATALLLSNSLPDWRGLGGEAGWGVTISGALIGFALAAALLAGLGSALARGQRPLRPAG